MDKVIIGRPVNGIPINSELEFILDNDTWIQGAGLHQVINRHGQVVRLCEACHSTATGDCVTCSSREICQIINANRFCTRMEYTAAAA